MLEASKIRNCILFLIGCSFLLKSKTEGFEFWNDLRVTWDMMPSGNAFARLPKNIIDADVDGWIQNSKDCSNEGQFNGFRWFYPPDNGVALLYDHHGNVAGIQTFAPQMDILHSNQTYRFDQVPMYQNHSIDGIMYFVITVYFTDPENICSSSKGNAHWKGNIGSNSQVYFQVGSSPKFLRMAPKSRSEATTSGWTVNQCIPGMGWHNFFEVEKYQESECTDSQPTCILYDENDQMHGFCLTYPGMTSVSNRWEHPNEEAIQATLGNAPKCALEQAALNGATAIHFYFTNKPWAIGCAPE